MVWKNQFKQRILKFNHSSLSNSISIKIRVTGGCFHREHSPKAYRIIDEYLNINVNNIKNISFEEHESGPELLILISAILGLPTAIIGLVTAIVSARSLGLKQGDTKDEALELIVRKFDDRGEMREEKVLRINSGEMINKKTLKPKLNGAIRRLFFRKLKPKSKS